MESVIETLLDLIKIPSISGHQTEIKKILAYVKKNFATPYCKIFEYDGASPVMLLSNGEEKDFDLIFIGHLDVVPAVDELFVPQIRNGKIYARGALDMKAGIAASLYTLMYIIKQSLPLKAGVLITTDEETTSAGIKTLAARDKINAKIVMDVDAGSLNTIIDKYKHPVSVKLTAAGKAGHSSRPWHGVNAVNQLMNCLKKLEENFPYFDINTAKPTSWCDTMTITGISSPVTLNVIPAEAEARLNFRLTEKTSLSELEKILNAACAANNCSYEVLLSSNGVYMDANHPTIQEYKNIVEQITGQDVVISQMPGATDSRVFADNSVIIMHGCNGSGCHSDDENVEIDSVIKLAEIQQRFADKLAKK